MSLKLQNYLFITIGSLLTALGVVGFLAPNKIATGGTAGLSIIFHYLFNLPTGILMVLINAPLLVVSVKYLGKRFAFRTIIAIGLISLFIDLLAEFFQFPCLSKDTLLSTIYGGLLIGSGLGLIFKGDASAGGGTIIAKIICSKFDIKTGTVILIIDIFVVILAGVVFKDIELALWSMISIFIASKFIDLILTGRKQNKIVHIAAINLEGLKNKIILQMGINGTLIKGDDLKNKDGRNIIFISINKNRITALKNLVSTHDKDAYMIVLEATELLGSSRKA